MKVATFVSGKVSLEKREELISGYSSALSGERPPGLEKSFLMSNPNDPGTYTIETIWTSREALDAMRGKGKPKAIELFEGIGVNPRVLVQNVEVVL